MNKTLKNTASIAIVVAVASSFIFATSSTQNTDNPTSINHIYPLPKAVNFAGEATPLHIIDVKERLDREMIINTNLHSSTILSIKRASRYFPVIEPILKKNGIPDDFKYLCVIESTLSNAVSSAGASGFWQFMKGTAKDYKMTVDEYLDQRYDLEIATEAACKYFKDGYRKFGSWTMVAAAYNRGMGGMTRAMESQGVNNYYDLFLNQETSRYVFRILALKEIMNAPEKYNYDIPTTDLYHPVKVKTVELNKDIDDLALYAKELGINYKLLKLYNPWLVNTSVKVYDKTYQLIIPTEGI